MDSEFFQTGRWTMTRLPDNKWQLEEYIAGDPPTVQVLCSNLAEADLADLKRALDSAFGNEQCSKCTSSHPREGPHHPAFDKWMRSLADYDNLLKRNKQEQLQARFEVSKQILTELLLMMDNIRVVVTAKALSGTSMTDEEIRIVLSSLDSMLQKNDVTPLFPGMSPTTVYNPDHHLAVEMVEGDVSETTIIPLMQGYLWRDKVLRTAQVRIVQPRKVIPPESSSPAPAV